MAILTWGSQSDRWRGITRPHLSQSIFLKTITPPGDSFYHTVTSWNRSRFGSVVIITEVASTIITVHSCYFGIIKFQLGLKTLLILQLDWLAEHNETNYYDHYMINDMRPVSVWEIYNGIACLSPGGMLYGIYREMLLWMVWFSSSLAPGLGYRNQSLQRSLSLE